MYGRLRTQMVGFKPFKLLNVPSRPYKYSAFYNLQGGINTFKPSHEIKNNELSDAYNVEYSTWGLKTRAGKEKYNATAIPSATSIRGLHVSYATGSRFILCADDLGEVWKDNGSGTLASVEAGYTADSHYCFHDWRTYTLWVNGTDELRRYDGSNIDTITAAPDKMIGIIGVENRLFGWNGTDNNLYFCDLNDETTWDVASEYSGFLIVPQVKGDFIIACARQGRSIIVFKGKSIWRYNLLGLPRNWTRELISDSLGIAGRFALDTIQDVIFFMGDDAQVYQLANTIKLISQNIDSPDTARWGLSTDIANAKRSQSIVKYLSPKGVVRVVYNDVSATTDYPNMYADYYITRDAWLRGNMSAYNIAITDGKDDTGYMYIGDVAAGQIYKIDTDTSDDETAIDAYFKTKDYDFGIVDVRKIFNSAYVSSRPVGTWNATITEYIDFASTGTDHNISQSGGAAVWDTAIWDTDVWGGAGLVRSRIDLGNNAGYYASYKVSCATLDKYFECRGLGIKYQLLEII